MRRFRENWLHRTSWRRQFVIPASRLIDQRIRDLGGWRGETLARMRALIVEADPGAVDVSVVRGTSRLTLSTV
jgi:hypothetical protein